MNLKRQLEEKLKFELKPTSLEIKDLSHLHKGHMDIPEQGETHFKIFLVSEQFKGLSRLKRHQLVHAVLVKEFSVVHSITLNLFSPEEFSEHL